MMIWVSFFFFKQKTAYEMRISDWSSDVCSSDLCGHGHQRRHERFNLLQSAVIGNQRPDIYQAIIHSRLRPDARRFNPVPGPEFQCVTPVQADIERSPDVTLSACGKARKFPHRSEEHTSELQSLMRISSAVFCLK